MTPAQRTMQLKTENTDVKFHPLMEHIFATSDARTGLKLRDTRMAFGPARNRSNSGEVMLVRLLAGHDVTNLTCSLTNSFVAS